ncbi:hypothetical protein [Brevundimonas faecalis]|uniref:DUF885 domain-containing protein n=1 Tax=Brevundimonas faecalis TaxID=947378 RepID=A0ABV2RB67_9CAUL
MRRMTIAALLGAALLTACATTPSQASESQPDSLDAVARDYVALTLEIGEREPGYVDAYYGPAEWAEAAKANPRALPQLAEGAAALTRRLETLPEAGLDADSRQRRAYLLAHVSAASARLGMLQGQKPNFADEAEALFGVRPELRPLSSYDPVLARIDALVPGEGPLADRVAAFRARYVVPKERLEPVMRAAIAECKARTERHMTLPADETFTLEFVNNKPWSGYNWYKGKAFSLIQVNTDLPIYIDRAVDLGCHEGYPGHHVYNALLERTFVQGKGWVEMSVYPLFSPMSFIAEGSANYGIDLAFPDHERTDFEQRVLYPLAGLDPATAEAQTQLLALTRQLARAEYTIADDYLAGRIDRETALDQLQKYGLVARDRAAQRLSFIETYRSYVINYGLGRDMVQAWVEGHGPDHWKTMERLLGSQILPVDLD